MVMSPKVTSSKNKKESKDSKCPESPMSSGSAPTAQPEVPSFPEGTTRTGTSFKSEVNTKEPRKEDTTHFPREFDLDSIEDDKDEQIEGEDKGFIIDDGIKFSSYFDLLARMMVKVFSEGKQIATFPTLVHNVVDRKSDSFVRLGLMNQVIAKMINSELLRIGKDIKSIPQSEYDYGCGLDIRVESFDKESALEFYLTSNNYEDIFIMTYNAMKVIILHVHVDDMVTYDDAITQGKRDMKKEDAEEDKYINHQRTTFRGMPIDLSGLRYDANNRGSIHIDAVNDRNGRDHDQEYYRDQKFSSPRSNPFRPRQVASPISIYDAEDYLVQNNASIIPFSQESPSSRIADLHSIAMTNIPDVASIPKLLKSHNVSYKKDENASTWYLRFNNFCAMIGIYLTPTKAMLKDSFMGKEWDNKGLPRFCTPDIPRWKEC